MFYGDLEEGICKKLSEAYNEFKMDELTFGRPQSVVLSISFCKPDDLFPLWRIYANNGKGVAIGVGVDKLKELAERNGFVFNRIEYLTGDKLEERTTGFWNECISLSKEEIVDRIKKYYRDGYFIKHKENEYEKEWRRASVEVDLSEYIILGRKVSDEYDMYARDNDLIMFRKIPIRDETILNNIEIGPNCKLTENEAKMFLNKYGVDVMGVGHYPKLMQ